jgi:serine/threonine protein phosphatase PrpC
MKSRRQRLTKGKSPENSSLPETGSPSKASYEPPIGAGLIIETQPARQVSPGDKEAGLEEADLASERSGTTGVHEEGFTCQSPPAPPCTTPSKNIGQSKWKDIEAGDWCPAKFVSVLEEALVNFKYQDVHSDEMSALPGWKMLGATRRGRMHANSGNHREDAFHFLPTQNSIVLCVSDGAGSSQFSRVGAEFTTRRLTHELSENFKRDRDRLSSLEKAELTQQIAVAMSEEVYQTIKLLHEIAEKANCTPKDLRCTLLLAVVYTNDKAKILLTSQVGDGFFAKLNDENEAQRFGASDSGEYSGQVTCFIPDPEAPARAKQILSLDLEKVEALLLCTDGIEDPFYPIDKNAKSIFDQLYHGVPATLPDFEMQPQHGPIIGERGAEERLRRWLSFEKKGENDDRTIVILHRDPVSRGPEDVQSVARDGA